MKEIQQVSIRIIDRLTHPDRSYTVDGVDNKITETDIKEFFKWFQDNESSRHFDPPITNLSECEEYYQQPNGLYLTARNYYVEPTGVLTIKRDPYYRDGGNIAYIEKMVVKPSLQGKGVGSRLVATAIDYIFSEEDPTSWEECRVWIMTDKMSGEWQNNFHFFIIDSGFQPVKEYALWSEYSRQLLGEEIDREALWLYTNANLWTAAKAKNPRLQAAPLELAGEIIL